MSKRESLKRRNGITKAMSVAVLVALGLTLAAWAAEVSAGSPEKSDGFRGPLRNGIYPAKGLLKKWPAEGPRLLWGVNVGKGWTSASVADGRVFFCGSEGADGVMRALDLDGKELWRTVYGPDPEPRATPAVSDGRVFYESVGAVMYALDAQTGKVLWSFDVAKAGDSLPGAGGNSGSPLVLGDRVIVATRSAGDEVPSFVALECATGKVAWLGNLAPAPEKGKGWSSHHGTPIAVRVGNRDAVFCNFFRGAGAVWADTGEKFWVDSIVKVKNRGRVQLVSNEGYLFLHGTVMAKTGEDGTITPLWEGKVKVHEYNISYSHTLIKDGRLVAFIPAGAMNPTAPGKLVMLDAQTGEEIAGLPAAAKGTFVWADGLIYLLDNRSAMVLIEATKDNLREVSSFKPPLGKYGTGSMVQLFTPPVVAEGRLFLRDQSRVLVYDLRIGQPPIRWSRTDNLLWTCALPGKALSVPAVENGVVYVMTDKGLASVQNGSVAWTASLPGGRAANGAPEPTPVVGEEKVYAAGNGGVLACFDARGKRQWKTDVTPNSSNRQVGSPILIEDLVVVQGKRLEAHRVMDGSPAWSVPVPDKKALTMPTRWRLADGVVLFTSWGAVVRTSDGKVLAEGLPELATSSPVAGGGAVYFCGSKTPGKPSAAAAYRLPDKAGDALNLERLWARRLDVVVDGTPLVDEGFVYFLDTEHTLHVLDASNGKPVYEELLVPEHEKQKAAGPGGDLMRAGGKLYAVNLGSRNRTVIIEPGRNFRKVWEYAVMDPCPGTPAFEMERQYICTGSAMYCIGGRTPVEPTSPEVMTVAPDTSLDGAADIPLATFADNEAPKEWIVLGPFKPRTLATDFLAGIGGATNAVLKMGQDIKYRTKTYSTRDLGAHEWFKPSEKKFTEGVEAIDVSKIVGREWDTTEYFFTVLEFDSPRCVQFRLLTPGGNTWHPKSRLEALAWLAGTPIEDGTMVRVAKGRYPLMLQVAVGTCESRGVIWMAPRFADVTGRVVEYERAVARWPAYRASLKELFVLGVPPRERQPQ